MSPRHDQNRDQPATLGVIHMDLAEIAFHTLAGGILSGLLASVMLQFCQRRVSKILTNGFPKTGTSPKTSIPYGSLSKMERLQVLLAFGCPKKKLASS